MKVCISAGNYGPPQAGGAHTFENQVFTTLVELASASKHQFFLFNKALKPFQNLSGFSIQTDSQHSLPRIELPSKIIQVKTTLFDQIRRSSKQSKWLKDRYQKLKLKALKGSSIDITISLSPGCLTMDIPYITIVWDLQHRQQPYFPEVSSLKEWESREDYYATMLRRAAIIITGTEVGKAEVERFYQVPSDRIRVLPLPTPQFALEAALSNENPILEKDNLPENYLFYPAQFWAHKNHVGLLHAVKWLRDKYNLIFPVVFSGSDKGNCAYVKQVADELDLSNQVHFLGFVSQDELIALYRNAFALTFLTFFGPDNLPPLEAMALGCPVVASSVPGAQEQLGDGALLVDPKSPEQIALAIKSLWDNPDLRQNLIQKGLERAYCWTTKDYVKGIFSILDDFEAIRRCWD